MNCAPELPQQGQVKGQEVAGDFSNASSMEAKEQAQVEAPNPEPVMKNDITHFVNEQYTPAAAPRHYWNVAMNPAAPNPGEGLPFLTQAILYPPSPVLVNSPSFIPYFPNGWPSNQAPATFRQEFGPENYQNSWNGPMPFGYNGNTGVQGQSPTFQPVPGAFFPSVIPQPQAQPAFQGGYFFYGPNPVPVAPPEMTGYQNLPLPYNVAVIDELMHHITLSGSSFANPNVPVQHENETQKDGYDGLGNISAGMTHANTYKPSGAPKQARKLKNQKYCTFCYANNETEQLWRSHRIRMDGKTSCPVLQKYVCPICGKTGEEAHTIKYCPQNNGTIPGHVHVVTGRNAAGLMTRRLFTNLGKRD